MDMINTDRSQVVRYVLIIDDNEDLALSLATLLHFYSCRVDVAYDGREGLRLALQKRYDVIFIDIGLPGMSGYDVVRVIRGALADPPILLAQTAYSQPEDLRMSSEAGFDAHLVKPVDPGEIVRHVVDGRSALGKSGRGAGGDSSPPGVKSSGPTGGPSAGTPLKPGRADSSPAWRPRPSRN